MAGAGGSLAGRGQHMAATRPWAEEQVARDPTRQKSRLAVTALGFGSPSQLRLALSSLVSILLRTQKNGPQTSCEVTEGEQKADADFSFYNFIVFLLCLWIWKMSGPFLFPLFLAKWFKFVVSKTSRHVCTQATAA